MGPRRRGPPGEILEYNFLNGYSKISHSWADTSYIIEYITKKGTIMDIPVTGADVMQAQALERIADSLEILNANIESISNDIKKIKTAVYGEDPED